ncbi:phenylacetic acid degradation protein [Rhodovulum sulfidophilum]|uniref:Phenylacetate-CoA oxygenase/reductase subunit PaaK n=1 Tax=Rhodovulum visakhapatnamense TaxID=364297 RepID=A0ABS1RE44_9RHOB|nr:1,2-phenylacetyl-CoA epoxidase subunit PaaE [Rhodovulum visakhapatnamense]MBL3569952.1 phenylacetate-CoA oxygenase/reductase subunit PaaK [Rhodovulum visakhapatnamense]MBL3577424.1 phenylacetate-CoA oxygenase/reductase subunit PaaK [Rhodovulum visakhapatnamense]OLS43411.1 phenylacetic acid degradation protein [Rhodovulum sulfidophilum]
MARFHPLTVTDIRRDTRDAVVLTLDPAEADRAAFAFTQGQYLTFRRAFDGEELRRCYSICSGLDDGCLRVGIKRVAGGAFSTWANEALKPGDVLEAMPPMGKFHAPLDPTAARHYLAFAAGSGITPVLSILRTVLSREPGARVTLVYANRQVSSIMFREELEDLKNTHLGRLAVIHVLGSETQEIDLFTGRIDAQKMDRLFAGWIDAASVDLAFICGPQAMMLTVADGLRRHGLTDDRIRFELFLSTQPGRARRRAVSVVQADSANATETSVTLDGTTRSFRMPKTGQSLLEAAIAADLDAPFSCKAGVCSTCRAKVLEGEVEMLTNHALEDYEVRAGYVLTCQCYPLSDRLVVSYDE